MTFTNTNGEFAVSWFESAGGQSTEHVEVRGADGTLVAAISASFLEDFHWTSAGFAAVARSGAGGEGHLRRWARDCTVLETRTPRALAAAPDAHGGTVAVEVPAQEPGAAGSPVPELLWIDPSGRVTRTVVLDGSAALAPGTDVLGANVVAPGANDHVLVILNRFPPGGGQPRPVARWYGPADGITAWFDASAGLLTASPLVLPDGRLALNGSYGMARGWSVFPDGVARVDPAPPWLIQASAIDRRSVVVIRGGRGVAVFGGTGASATRGIDVLTAGGDACGTLLGEGAAVGVDGTVFQARAVAGATTCELTWWSGLLR